MRVAEADGQAVSIGSWACWAISDPWSQLSDRRNWSGRVPMVAAMASRTAWAPCSAEGRPFLTGLGVRKESPTTTRWTGICEATNRRVALLRVTS